MPEPESYTYVSSPAGTMSCIIRASDNASIPLSLSNMDYQAFLAWIAAGNAAPAGWTGPTNPMESPPTEQAQPPA